MQSGNQTPQDEHQPKGGKCQSHVDEPDVAAGTTLLTRHVADVCGMPVEHGSHVHGGLGSARPTIGRVGRRSLI